ncbi:WD repeat-containing protein 75 [Spea bombifrons]|uniref:WD repeat-containing protein 75 n=1 Tax=Spea bombifrons TaxID=233779 RepID=UPI00234BF3CA|nr:WD repeat-containing protein 75 [Spea bombifrons]
MVAKGEIRVVRSGGSKINYRRAVFSTDAKYLLCVSGDYIKLFSTSTEECVHVLQGHKDLVTGIQLNPKNHLQLYSCSLDGTIKLWDFMDGILIKTFSVGYKLLALYTTVSASTIYAIIPKNNNAASDTFQLISIKLPKSTNQECKDTELTTIFDDVSPSPKCTAVGRDGEYIATAKGLNLFVYYFKNKKYFRMPLSPTSKKGANNIFAVVACHPSEDCIATGHNDGRIRLWRNFNHKQDYTYTSLHWHHDVVMDLSFSAQGTKLFSGGIESVLVQWTFGSEQSKEFLPRLGAAIEHISTSPDGSLHCTSHADNKISIISAGLKVSAVIQGLVKGNDVKTGLTFDPKSKALVLNGKPGHLQFYSLQKDKQLYNLDIVQQEFVHQAGLQYMDLVKAAFNNKGDWLATVEELQGADTEGLEIQLKFWEYQEASQSFVLNTTVNMPHEDQITSMCFWSRDRSEKDAPSLVTTGKDGLFKVWVLRDDSDIYKQSSGWFCDFVGSYHKNKATYCSFSEDSSLLAVSFEEIVTIWDTSSWEMKVTFCHPPGRIRSLCFGRMNCSKYLLASSSNGFINCWNLLTCTLAWRAQLDAAILEPDSQSENIAAFSYATGSTNLIVFKPDEPRPIYIQKDICREKVQYALFVPRDVPETPLSDSHHWLIRSQLYFLTEIQELMTFSTKSPEQRLAPLSKQSAAEESLPVTPFHILLGKKRQQEQEKQDLEMGRSSASSHKVQGVVAIKELLHTPAHVLPPTNVLCTIFVNALLISKQRKSTQDEANKDVEMESEESGEESEEEEEVVGEVTEDQEPFPTAFSDDLPQKLPKSQEKELRRIRKTDFSWISAL